MHPDIYEITIKRRDMEIEELKKERDTLLAALKKQETRIKELRDIIKRLKI